MAAVSAAYENSSSRARIRFRHRACDSVARAAGGPVGVQLLGGKGRHKGGRGGRASRGDRGNGGGVPQGDQGQPPRPGDQQAGGLGGVVGSGLGSGGAGEGEGGGEGGARADKGSKGWGGPLEAIDDYRWRIPATYKPGMRVPGIIYADRPMLDDMRQDQAAEQVANVATLPGVVNWSLAMPDIHWGYGFPIGGVAAMDAEGGTGVISPGGVGYDINCGVRLLLTALDADEVRAKADELMTDLFASIPSGLGTSGKIKVGRGDMNKVLRDGARWAVDQGYGWREDLDHIEEGGAMDGAVPDQVSERAVKRGSDQLGTLGSGNHFLEVDIVAEVYDEDVARAFGLEEGLAVVLIHSGSRGLGHQVCTDYLRVVEEATRHYGIQLPDRQLACAPLDSPEGRAYFEAMACAANYAWANRQCLMHWTRESFERVFRRSAHKLGMRLVYDQAHNIAKFEEHVVGGKKRRLCVHRKGAARAFPAGRPEVPAAYRAVGQPVLVPGDMGRASYVMVGTPLSLDETWGSACHGAGRRMSRGAAKRGVRGSELRRELLERGIVVRAESDASLAEEAPDAYKDVTHVVNICHNSGIARRVARLKPLGVMKG